jgi:hypothetical protein
MTWNYFLTTHHSKEFKAEIADIAGDGVHEEEADERLEAVD